MQRRRDESIKKTFKDMLETIEKEQDSTEKFDHIIVFYSTDYIHYINSIKDRIKKLFRMEPVLIGRGIEEDNLLKEYSVEKIRIIDRARRDDLLRSAVSGSPSLYVEGWDRVTEVSKLGKIDTLFIVANAKRNGFLVGDQVYTSSEDGSNPVENIAPWIVRTVLNSGGDVIVFNEPLNNKRNVISAKLRF